MVRIYFVRLVESRFNRSIGYERTLYQTPHGIDYASVKCGITLTNPIIKMQLSNSLCTVAL